MQPNFLEHKTSSLLVMDLPSTFNLMEPAPSVLIASSKHSSFLGRTQVLLSRKMFSLTYDKGSPTLRVAS